MKKEIWLAIGAIVAAGILGSAFYVVPMLTPAVNSSASGNSPEITRFQLDTMLFCYPLNVGTEPKNGYVQVHYQFTVIADLNATAGLTLVELTIEHSTHAPDGSHTGYVTYIVYRSRPGVSSDLGFGSSSFPIHPRDLAGTHPHWVRFVLSATDSTGTTTDVLRIDLPDCYEN